MATLLSNPVNRRRALVVKCRVAAAAAAAYRIAANKTFEI
jgi:hypothetical protein